MTTCSMSVNLEQTDGKEGIDGEVMGPLPQPAKPKDDNCATAVAAPSFSSSRRVKFPIACFLDALSEAQVGPHGKSVSLETLLFLVARRLFPSNGPTKYTSFNGHIGTVMSFCRRR